MSHISSSIISIIGCGHMGTAIVKALKTKKIGRIFVSNPIKPHLNVKWTTNNCEAAENADIVLIAVKPNAVQTVLKEIKPVLKTDQIIISIAAGVPLERLALWSGNHKKIVRVMPNLPAQIFEGMSVWKASSAINKAEKRLIQYLLSSFGKEIEAKDEKLIDIATAVSGGGPAYVAAFLESLAYSAQKIGFSKPCARLLALQSVYGSVLYMQKTGLDFTEVKNAVQTKGGTTEAGFKILKKGKWQKTLEKALFAGYKRARKISK
ncbi:pyrroline-5-carboxylate reductase [Candidatus Peregrinibacteria bacterium]|nr:pyrroline-5-carboxylate reductase [Candidatus Peregrinibacteria bacterium]